MTGTILLLLVDIHAGIHTPKLLIPSAETEYSMLLPSTPAPSPSHISAEHSTSERLYQLPSRGVRFLNTVVVMSTSIPDAAASPMFPTLSMHHTYTGANPSGRSSISVRVSVMKLPFDVPEPSTLPK